MPRLLPPLLSVLLLACQGISSQAFTLDGGQGFTVCGGGICRPGEHCDLFFEECQAGCASDLNCAAAEECAKDGAETGACAPRSTGAKEGDLCDEPGVCAGGALLCYHPAGDLHGTCLRRCSGYPDCDLGSNCCPVPGISSASACVPNTSYDCSPR